MPTKKETPASQYDHFRGKFTFTTEPLWFRLVLCVLIMAALGALLIVIHEYALPALAIRWLSGIKMLDAFKWVKSHSP